MNWWPPLWVNLIASRVRLQINNQDCHVVATNSLCGPGVVAQNLIQHLFSDVFGFLCLDTLPHKLDGFFICEAVPNTVTSKDKKFVLWIQRDPARVQNDVKCYALSLTYAMPTTSDSKNLLHNIRLCGNHLIRRSYSGYLFVF